MPSVISVKLAHRFLLAALLALVAPLILHAQDSNPDDTPAPDVHIAATTSTQSLLSSIAHLLKEQQGVVAAVSANLTSAANLADLAGGHADIAFLTKPLSGEDRATYPDLDLVVTPVGMQVVALGVSDDVWDAGVHTITQDQMRAIYEQKIKNWKELKGPDEKINFFSFEQGGGMWEIFAEWMYGDNRKAPLSKGQDVANSQDARDALEFGDGGIAPIGASLVDGTRCHALSVIVSGTAIAPTAAQVAAGIYPMVRPMSAVTIGRPTLNIRKVTEFLTGPDGQRIIKNSGALGLEAVPTPTPDKSLTY